MIKKKKSKRTDSQKVQKYSEEQQLEKSKNLIFGGVLLAISSIGLLIFVLSEKVFHFS
tara:strand:- start:28 stop:201 length:174 start_codon:yes stop_codon:yes gene_type:complete